MPEILAEAHLGYVHMTVSELDQALMFYQHVLGLQIHDRDQHTAVLGVGRAALVALTENPGARRMHGTTGLRHFAIQVPSRLELAKALKRIHASGLAPQRLVDNGVSEAIYLNDPDGNGIIVYRDHVRLEWDDRDVRSGVIAKPLNVDDVAELGRMGGSPDRLDSASVIGHVHLYVSNRREAEAFYVGLLGFNLGSQAPTSSSNANESHYHPISVSQSPGIGAPPPLLNAIGLRYFAVQWPHEHGSDQIVGRLREAGLAVRNTAAGWLVYDPSHNGILLTGEVMKGIALWETGETFQTGRRVFSVGQVAEQEAIVRGVHVPPPISKCIGDRWRNSRLSAG